METSVPKSHIGVVTHLFMLVLVHTRPCYEGGDFESCFPSKALNYDVGNSGEQYSREHSEEARPKYDVTVRAREMRGILEEYLKNCTGCEESDVVDREDHFTQYLSELLVNTDSEITSLQLMTQFEPAVDSGTQVDVAFLDFRKAFDTVDNDVLLKKLALADGLKLVLEVSYQTDCDRMRADFDRVFRHCAEDGAVRAEQGSDVEEIKEDSRSSSNEDGYFASLTGVEKR